MKQTVLTGFVGSRSLDPKDAISSRTKWYPGHGNVITYVFRCSGYLCNGVINVQKCNLGRVTGLCKRCVQKGKPFEAKYNELLKNCKRRNIFVSLTYQEFVDFTKQDKCHYCLDIIDWKPFTRDMKDHAVVSRSYNLDRTDNSKGYTKENCVVCCWKCNSAKGNRYTYEEWFHMTEYFRNKASKKE